ncbi:hypothetical protein [Selenomonas ruminantium]|uniref:Uncharacterized protein n=1 Tax=Selenomonas ruminantium TaxID=971 RepID=A0A1I0V5E3_SELRU|nr:hypothetical protein [Selenomonas ruminantium]SFA71564.1 hypothetical protein SAMN05216587_101287 [Selenomonas ruminantium]
MAKRGQEIDELYISLGLDIARLQLDFDTAGKTVSQAVSRLNTRTNQIKLKMDVDLAKLDGVGSELDKLKVKHEAINRQLDLQRSKEEILVAVLREAQANSGAGSEIAQRAQSNLLKQQKVVAQTEAEVRRLTIEMTRLGGVIIQNTSKAGAFGTAMRAGMNRAKIGVDNLLSGFTMLSVKAAAVMAVFSTGAGLFNLTKGAMESGESLYRLTKRLHTTAAEAGQLNRTFQLAGMDVSSIIPLIARLDKQVETAGETGNITTQAMERFGMSILDQAGNLLPLNEQLDQLAKGYKNAMESGQEEAYTAEVLGARGAALIPLLEQYDELMEVAGSVKTTGLLNPEESHKTWLQWKAMEMEVGQLKAAIGTALLPLSMELLPEVTDGFRNLVEEIQSNKDSIKDAISGWGSALKTVAEALVFVGEQFKVVSDHAKANKWLIENHPAASPLIAVPIAGGAVLDKMYGDEYKAYLEEQKALEEKAKAEKQAAAEAEKNKQAQEANTRASRSRTAAEKQAAKTTQEAAKANAQLTESLYELTHNELENSLHSVNREIKELQERGADAKLLDEYKLAKQAKVYEDFQRNVVDSTQAVYRTDLQNQLANIDREAQAYRQKGLDEVSAASWAEASKAKIREQWENEIASKIDSVWKTELQNRLDDIEREKQAWIQKGLDEVKATQWAEKEKIDAKRNAALQVLQAQKEEFQAYLAGGQQGLAAYYKEVHGFTMDDLRMTPEQLEGFQRARKDMLENLLPNFRDPAVIAAEQQRMKDSFQMSVEGRDYTYDEVMGNMQTEVKGIREQMDKLGSSAALQNESGQAALQTVTNAPHLEVNVNIDTAVTQDSESMSRLADQVADKITPVVEQALGSGELAY